MRRRLAIVWDALANFVRAHAVELCIVLAVVAFIFVLFPRRVVIDVPPGEVGVVWRRFQGGTDLCRLLPEGTHLIFPWDEVIIFDGRLIQRSLTLDGLTNNGLAVKLTVMYRYQLIQQNIPVLFKYAGRDYPTTLIDPVIDVVARNAISERFAGDIYADRALLQSEIRDHAAWSLYASNDPTNIPRTLRTPDPGFDQLIPSPEKPKSFHSPAPAVQSTTAPDNKLFTENNRRSPKFAPTEPLPAVEHIKLSKSNFLPCPGGSPVSHFVWLNLDNILITSVTLPPTLQESITQSAQEQQLFLTYYWKERVAQAEAVRMRAEAAGVRDASIIMSKGLTNNYLRYAGIQATRAIATSTNAKVILIGGGRDGLPVVLGADAGSATSTAMSGSGNDAPATGPMSPQQYLEHQLSQ